MDLPSRTVIFAHGLEGRPDGLKPTALREAGLRVVAPDGRGKPLVGRIEDLEQAVAQHEAPVLVGSSYGGLAALALAHLGRPLGGLVLLAPALTLSEPPIDDALQLRVPPGLPAAILHGLRDEVVPIEASRELVRRCPHVVLHELDDGHDLRGSLDRIVEAVRAYAVR